MRYVSHLSLCSLYVYTNIVFFPSSAVCVFHENVSQLIDVDVRVIGFATTTTTKNRKHSVCMGFLMNVLCSYRKYTTDDICSAISECFVFVEVVKRMSAPSVYLTMIFFFFQLCRLFMCAVFSWFVRKNGGAMDCVKNR